MTITGDPIIVEPKFWSKTTWIQLGYGVWVNQLLVLMGLSFGFSAVTIPQLRRPEAPFKCSSDELSWITSVLALAAAVGCIISGFIMDRIGRRWVLVLCLVPMVVGWIYTGTANSAGDLILGRIMTGIGVGMCASPPRTYVTEITLPYVRGFAGVIPTVSIGLGITTEGLLGKIFMWNTLCYICGVYATLVMIFNLFLPETPYFILMSGDIIKTKKALRKIRAKNYDIEIELYTMNKFRRNNDIYKLPLKKVFFKLFTPYACKPFSIIMVYLIIGQMVGISITMFWTVDILKASRLSLDPYIGNIILGVTRMVGGACAAVLVFWVPRRLLAVGSAFSIGFLCLGLGIFIYVTAKPSIVPLFGYALYVALTSLGYISLPLLMLYELLPLEVRGLLGGITDSLLFAIMFLVNLAFPAIRARVELPYIVMFFGISSLIGCIYLYLFLPETHGLTLQEIEEYYRGRRITLERSSSLLELSRRTARSRSSILAHQQSIQLLKEEEKNDLKPKTSSAKKLTSVTFIVADKDDESKSNKSLK